MLLYLLIVRKIFRSIHLFHRSWSGWLHCVSYSYTDPCSPRIKHFFFWSLPQSLQKNFWKTHFCRTSKYGKKRFWNSLPCLADDWFQNLSVFSPWIFQFKFSYSLFHAKAQASAHVCFFIISWIICAMTHRPECFQPGKFLCIFSNRFFRQGSHCLFGRILFGFDPAFFTDDIFTEFALIPGTIDCQNRIENTDYVFRQFGSRRHPASGMTALPAAVFTDYPIICAAECTWDKPFPKNTGAFACCKVQQVMNSLRAGQSALSTANVFRKIAGTVASLNGTWFHINKITPIT